MNKLYHFINDLDNLKSFITLLPELKCNEFYYFQLIARKKYHSSIKGNNIKIAEFISKKEDIISNIKRLEINDYYTYKGNIINPLSLVLYINPNSRNLEKASSLLINQLNSLLYNVKYDKNLKINPIYESYSIISSIDAKSYRYFIDIDIDEKINLIELKHSLDNILSINSYSIVETLNGYHILIIKNQIKNSKFYLEMKNFTGIDINLNKDHFLPIPGTIQSNFIPKLITF